jgi:hypothetical protein
MRKIGLHIRAQGLLRLHRPISDLRQILPNLRISEVVPGLIQELLVPALVRIDVVQSIDGESDQRVPARWLVVPQSAEVDDLDQDGENGSPPADDDLVGFVLRDDESGKEVHTEDIGVELQELELNAIIYHLHAIVVVYVHLVLHVKVD